MARQFRRPMQRRGNRAPTQWTGFLTSAYAALAANSSVILGSVSVIVGQPAQTIRRIRGVLSIASDQSTADEQQIGALGCAVVTDAAIAVGITAMPDPFTDIDQDVWMLYEPFAQKFEFITGVGFESNIATSYSIDNKAMRRVEDGQSLAFILSNAHATHGLLYSVNFRILHSATRA